MSMNCRKVQNQQSISVRKKKEEAGQLQNKMMDMLDKDDDEIELVFQAWPKGIKRNLNDEETEDLMEDLNATKHMRKSRAKQNPSPQIGKVSINIDRPGSIPMIGQENNDIPSASASTQYSMPVMTPMPALQRMNNFTYDREITYEQL